jgi:hypothetical protein
MKNLICVLLIINAVSGFSQNSELYTRLSSTETGVTFNNKIKDDKDKNILLYANFYGGAGVGVGDGRNNFQSVDFPESGFMARKDAKKLRVLKGKNKTYILVANNNDVLQVFELENTLSE